MLALAFILSACSDKSHSQWQKLYSEARDKLDRHESVAAEELADKGLQATANKDAVLNYQFRILKAERRVHINADEAAKLLESTFPPSLVSSEFDAQKETIQALVFAYKKDLPRSDECFKNARQIAEKSAPSELTRIALLQAYADTLPLRHSTGEQYYRETIDLAHRYQQPLLEADGLNNLALIEMNVGHYDEAINLSNGALAIAQPLQAIAAMQLALGNMGWSYYQIGDFDNGTRLLIQAREAAQRAERSRDQERWSRDLGNVYLAIRDYVEAQRYYSDSLALAKKLENQQLIADSLNNLTQLKLQQNDLRTAKDYNHQSTAVLSQTQNSDWSYCWLNTAEIAMHQKQFARAEKPLQAIVSQISHGKQGAKNYSLLRRAQSDLANIYMAENKSGAADREFQAAIHTVEEARGRVQEAERRMSILDAWPFFDDYLRFLTSHKAYGRALEIAEFSRSRTLAEGLGITGSEEPGTVSIGQMQGLLKQQSKTVLAYWLADQESYLWVVSSALVKLFRLPPRQEIEKQIADYSAKLLDHRGIEDSDSGQKLYEMLIGPAHALVPKGSTVIVIPHRTLYKLNFETLVVTKPKPHYFIEDATFEVAGSMALLTAFNQKRSATSKKLLLVGAPVRAPDSEFGVLANAGDEIEKVKSHFPLAQEEVITGKGATPAAYDSAHAELFEYIHFVTHGKASNTSPLDSAIILSPQADRSFKLYARSIVNSHVNAGVVTISACESAGTKTYSGEGLVGLAWAFLRAGAHRVVAGLWEVDDRATPDLMDNFYAGMQHSKPSEALRQAKLNMIHAKNVYRFPYYWASLQLYMGS